MTGDGFDMFVANGADEVMLLTTFQKSGLKQPGLQITSPSNEYIMLYPEAANMR